jgi:glycosyltransferase involved in cell wall biosynthesis
LRLSLVVPVCNGQSVLSACLAGIARAVRENDEVIVVDDGSTDDTAAVVRAHGATLVPAAGSPRGPAWARNRGATLATGDILVFVDADVVLHADALARMAATFAEQPRLHALFGSYDAEPTAPGLPSRFKNLLHHYVHQHSRREAGSFWAACGAVRREAFFAVGGFDERFAEPSIEDIELGRRFARAGMSIRLCPEIQGTHLKRWTLASLWRTDVFARAVPWTKLVLREGNVPNDLNLTWRSRASAVFAWSLAVSLGATAVLSALGQSATAEPAALVAAVCLAVTTLLNLDLHRFFVRRGGVRFAAGAWLLHYLYLLYGSAVFAALAVVHAVDVRAHEPQSERPHQPLA